MARTRLLAGAFFGHKNTTVSRNKLFSKGPIAVEKAHGKNAAFEKHNLREIHGKLRQSVLHSATADHTSSRTIATVHSLTSIIFYSIAALSLPDLSEPDLAMVLPRPKM